LILAVSMLDMGQMSAMAGDIMLIVVTVYSVVGLALVHALIAKKGMHVGWLVALYVFMFFIPPHAMVALASAGFADSWLNFRGRLSAIKNSDVDNHDDKQ
jgi:hypothetical protein